MLLIKKNILFILFVLFVFNANISLALDYKVGQTIKDSFQVSKKFKIDLSSGEWTLVQKNSEFYYGLSFKSYVLIKTKNNKFIEGFLIEEIRTAGVVESSVNNEIIKFIFKNKYDGCYERPEYFYLNFYRKGSTHNCFRVGHRDIKKRIYDPRDPEEKNLYPQLKKWLEENSVNLPKVALWSSHSYFSRRASSNLYNLHYYVDTSIINAPENKYFTEETSEYHKNKIKNFPEHEKSMKKWMSISTQRHRNFEKSVRALDKHLLNLDEISLENYKSNNNIEDSTDIVKEIQKLNELYKEGVLTKDEFEKAKKKILN
jgi:hypothetical protein